MKRVVAASIILLAVLLAARFPEHRFPIETVQENLRSQLAPWVAGLEDLDKAVGSGNTEKARQAFTDSRLLYKPMEYLLEYLQPEYCKDYINGAPLPRIERNAAGIPVVEPEGYQRLEEVLFDEEVDWQTARHLSAELLLRGRELSALISSLRLYDRQVMEAQRTGVIRIMALGITGFDNPVREDGVKESAAAFRGMEEGVLPYLPLLAEREPALAKELKTLFRNGRARLEAADFSTLDRLAFIREELDPLYGALLDLQQTLYIETRRETGGPLQPLNFEGRHLFAEDFLNPYAYADLPESEDTEALRQLGEKLFFDPVLSEDLSRSCASCHRPELAFTDGLAKSLATGKQGHVQRNAPTLVNAAYSAEFFYDLRAERLEQQIEHVITSEKEFNTDYPSVMERLSGSAQYQTLFRNAFPKLEERNLLSKYSVSTALAAYVLSLRGMNSRVDRHLRGEEAELTDAEKRGFNLFMGKATCGTCHFAPVFNGGVPPLYLEMEAEVLGVPSAPGTDHLQLDADLGKQAGTLKQSAEIYAHAFKTVTVRNVQLTGPYMHNGVYTTLREVVEFYNDGGGTGRGLVVENQTLPPDSLGLSEMEINDLVSFMEALTDNRAGKPVAPVLPRDFARADINARQTGGVY